MKKITGNTIVGFLFAAAAGITLYISNATLKSASAMGDPGPKMFPNAVCIAILILSVIIMVQSVFKSEKPFKGALSTPEGKQGCTRMILVLSDLALFLILWRYVPFLAAGVIFYLPALYGLQRKTSVLYYLFSGSDRRSVFCVYDPAESEFEYLLTDRSGGHECRCSWPFGTEITITVNEVTIWIIYQQYKLHFLPAACSVSQWAY